MNRIQRMLDERAESPRCDDFFVVVGEFGRVFVTREAARRLRATLNRVIVPRWTSFRDITDALFTVRTAHVNTIVESTFAQRAASRQFWRDREKEEKDAEEEHSDRRPWDPD